MFGRTRSDIANIASADDSGFLWQQLFFYFIDSVWCGYITANIFFLVFFCSSNIKKFTLKNVLQIYKYLKIYYIYLTRKMVFCLIFSYYELSKFMF